MLPTSAVPKISSATTCACFLRMARLRALMSTLTGSTASVPVFTPPLPMTRIGRWSIIFWRTTICSRSPVADKQEGDHGAMYGHPPARFSAEGESGGVMPGKGMLHTRRGTWNVFWYMLRINQFQTGKKNSDIFFCFRADFSRNKCVPLQRF